MKFVNWSDFNKVLNLKCLFHFPKNLKNQPPRCTPWHTQHPKNPPKTRLLSSSRAIGRWPASGETFSQSDRFAKKKRAKCIAGWWFQHLWKILVKLDHFIISPGRAEKKTNIWNHHPGVHKIYQTPTSDPPAVSDRCLKVAWDWSM